MKAKNAKSAKSEIAPTFIYSLICFQLEINYRVYCRGAASTFRVTAKTVNENRFENSIRSKSTLFIRQMPMPNGQCTSSALFAVISRVIYL